MAKDNTLPKSAPTIQLVISYNDPDLENRNFFDEVTELQGYIEKSLNYGLSPKIELTVNGAPVVKVG